MNTTEKYVTEILQEVENTFNKYKIDPPYQNGISMKDLQIFRDTAMLWG